MAICRNCGSQSPDGLPQCPRCGAPMMQPKKKKTGCLIAVFVVLGLSMISALFHRNDTPKEASNPESSYSAESKQESKEERTTEAVTTTATESVTESIPEAGLSLILEAETENAYSEKLTMNAGTEFEEVLIVYVLPAGKYSVRNIAEKPDQFNVYSKETVTTEAGWEEPAEIGFVKLLQPDESAEFEMKDNQYIEIHKPAKFEITAIE